MKSPVRGWRNMDTRRVVRMCDITFIIPVHNPGDALDDTLVSLRTINALRALTWEAIVVDMACSDGSTDRIRRWIIRDTALRASFMTTVHRGEAIGHALDDARGTWIHILRAGDHVDPRGLAQAIKNNGASGSSGGTACVGGVQLNDDAGRAAYAIMHPSTTCTRDDVFDRLHSPLAGVLIPSSAMRRLRDECATMTARDGFGPSDLLMLLAERGLECSVVPNVFCARAAREHATPDDAVAELRDGIAAIQDSYARQVALPVDQRAMHVTPARLQSCLGNHVMRAATRCLLRTIFTNVAIDAAELMYSEAGVESVCAAPIAAHAGQLAALHAYGALPVCDATHLPAWAQSMYAWWKRCETRGWLEEGGAQPMAPAAQKQIASQRIA